MPKKNKSMETVELEHENTNDDIPNDVADFVDKKKDNTEVILDGDMVEAVFTVEYIEKTVYQFTAVNRKEALRMIKDEDIIGNPKVDVVSYERKQKTNSLEQIGYRLKNE